MVETFAQIPTDVVQSEAYMTLPGKAPQVLSFIAARYRKTNNGDLSATYTELRVFGYHNETSRIAFKALIDRGLLIRTREGKGSGQKVCSLYALGWRPISEDVIPKIRAAGYTGPVQPTHSYLLWTEKRRKVA